MTSSAADRFMGGGGGGEEQMLLHHPQMYYHVPQHSRREKLRFPPEDQALAPTSLLLLHDPNAAPPLYPANSLTAFLPSFSSTSSSHYSHNPALNYGVAQFDGHGALQIPAQHHHHQIPSQGFSLSLSSTSCPRPSASRQHLVSRPAPLGPFTGYAAVLNSSRFLEPARKLLEEVCHVGHHAAGGGGSSGSREMLLDADPPRESLVDHGGEGLQADHGMKEDRPISGTEQQWKKSRLLSMLDEVYRRYKQYYQQVQAVITSFESVAGLSTAAPYASVALKAMSKHFRSLKNIISDQLHQTNKGLGNEGICREEISSFGLLDNSGYLQRATNSTGTFGQPHVWRPQRGLPERAVCVLRSWLFEHFLHPYPTDVDKQNLAKQTGLTRNQVSNWFINARVRLWKPMVEEIHSLEMRQKNKMSSSDNNRNTDEQPQPPSSSRTNPFHSQPVLQTVSSQSHQYSSTKGIQEELTPMPNHIQEPVNFVCDDISNHQHVGGGVGVATGGNGVSLTLGLHQNNGVCFSEPLPLNVARCFGLEECNDTYLVSTFGDQERQFAKDVGSRLLHDFVG